MRMLGVVLALVAGGCAARAPVAGPGEGAGTGAAVLPSSIHWTRASAEHRAIFLQTYAWAGERVRALATQRAAGTWAVVLDADETVIDNSTYQRERAERGLGFSPDSWAAWVARREATALPGAAAFLRLVRELGGLAVIVTNRTQSECADTRANLEALTLAVDAVLCRPPDTSDKNPRFEALERGTAAPGLPPLEIVLWIGDNIQDFPELGQGVRFAADSAFAMFGTRYVLLPNPMYGSWERNEVR